MDHKTRASVRLTEEAHLLLVDIAERNGLSMKMVGSEAIHMLDRARKAEKMYRERIEQLKFKAKKLKQVVIVQLILACSGVGLLGFILGVNV